MCLLQSSWWKANCVWLTVTVIGRNLAPLFGHSCYHIWEAGLAWGSEKQEGYWLLSSWHQASFRQAIPGEQLSGLIAPKKKDGEETNKLSTESVIYRLNDKKQFSIFLFFFFHLTLSPSCCSSFCEILTWQAGIICSCELHSGTETQWFHLLSDWFDGPELSTTSAPGTFLTYEKHRGTHLSQDKL